ncbi:MAG: AAA family ATPase, partial [Pseudonocardia sp.]|nr:AAA family ATPase [Pseudonocardia sp.]
MAGSTPALVGREAELAGFAARLESLRAGRGGLVLLSGEAGIGKSRLAETVVELAAGAGVRAAFGRCQETEGAPPFWPWMQLLPAVVGSEPDLERLAPLLRSKDVDADGADRFQLFDAATTVLVREAGKRPLVIVLDDLHRADEASLALLRFVLPVLRRTPILVLGAYRPTEVPARHPLSRLLGEASGDLAFELVELGGLTLAQSAELARRMRSPVPDLADVHDLTGGNPFYLAEVLRMGPARGVPPTVELAIRARLDRLPAGTRELLAVAAVLGRDVDPVVLAVLAGRDELAVARDLAPAVDAGVMSRQEGGAHRFDHILVQQVLYQEWPAPDVTRLHDHAVEAIAGLGHSDDDSRLAHHAARATAVGGGRARAVELAVRAARNAVRRLAHEEASDWFGRAVGLGVPAADRPGLLLERGTSAARPGPGRGARRSPCGRPGRRRPPRAVAAGLHRRGDPGARPTVRPPSRDRR